MGKCHKYSKPTKSNFCCTPHTGLKFVVCARITIINWSYYFVLCRCWLLAAAFLRRFDIYWHFVFVEWPHEYTTSGENCFRWHSLKMSDIVPKIAEHVRMGSVVNNLCWLLIATSMRWLTECVFACFGRCAVILGGANNHIFANFSITTCRPTPKFWWGHHGVCAHHSNHPPPPPGARKW